MAKRKPTHKRKRCTRFVPHVLLNSHKPSYSNFYTHLESFVLENGQ